MVFVIKVRNQLGVCRLIPLFLLYRALEGSKAPTMPLLLSLLDFWERGPL